jgi:hypothetical protein
MGHWFTIGRLPPPRRHHTASTRTGIQIPVPPIT